MARWLVRSSVTLLVGLSFVVLIAGLTGDWP